MSCEEFFVDIVFTSVMLLTFSVYGKRERIPVCLYHKYVNTGKLPGTYSIHTCPHLFRVREARSTTIVVYFMHTAKIVVADPDVVKV